MPVRSKGSRSSRELCHGYSGDLRFPESWVGKSGQVCLAAPRSGDEVQRIRQARACRILFRQLADILRRGGPLLYSSASSGGIDAGTILAVLSLRR